MIATLKSLPAELRVQGTPKGSIASLRPATSPEALKAAEIVQAFAIDVITRAVNGYFEAVAAVKQMDTAVDAYGMERWPFEIAHTHDRFFNLLSESKEKAESHLARIIQCLQSDVGPTKLNTEGFEFGTFGLRFGDHLFLSVPRNDDCNFAQLICVPARDVFEPVTEGVRL